MLKYSALEECVHEREYVNIPISNFRRTVDGTSGSVSSIESSSSYGTTYYLLTGTDFTVTGNFYIENEEILNYFNGYLGIHSKRDSLYVLEGSLVVNGKTIRTVSSSSSISKWIDKEYIKIGTNTFTIKAKFGTKYGAVIDVNYFRYAKCKKCGVYC